MKTRKELKRVLIAGVATLSLLSGCSKNNTEEQSSNIEVQTKESDYSYYMILDDEYIEIENVKRLIWNNGRAYLTFNDDSQMIVPLSNLYVMDKTSEEQNELVQKLTK